MLHLVYGYMQRFRKEPKGENNKENVPEFYNTAMNKIALRQVNQSAVN